MRAKLLLTIAWLTSLSAPAAATPLSLAYSVGVGAAGALERFDGMGPTGTRAPGAPDGAGGWNSYWSLLLQGATPAQQYDSLGLPPLTSIDAYNGGAVGGSDRALGLYTTATGIPTRHMTARFRNDTGAPLASFHLEFDVEFWLQRSTSRWAGLQAWLSLDGVSFLDLGPAFEATLTNTTNTGWVDGNDPANARRGVGGLVDLAALGLAPVAPGADFYLRFHASQGLSLPAGYALSQNRNMAAFLDDVWVGTVDRAAGLVAVPEPKETLLLALGLIGLGAGLSRPPQR